MAESLAEVDPLVASPAAAAAGAMTALEGSLVSLLAGPRGASSLAVVRLLQEDAMAEPATLTAVGAGVGGEENGSVPLVGDEQEKDVDRVELADALFGAAEPRLSQQNHGKGTGGKWCQDPPLPLSRPAILASDYHPDSSLLIDSCDCNHRICPVANKTITLRGVFGGGRLIIFFVTCQYGLLGGAFFVSPFLLL